MRRPGRRAIDVKGKTLATKEYEFEKWAVEQIKGASERINAALSVVPPTDTLDDGALASGEHATPQTDAVAAVPVHGSASDSRLGALAAPPQAPARELRASVCVCV